MSTARRLSLLLSLAALAGCTYLTNIQPQETRGGFSVLVDVAGQPASARVFADIEAFAQRRGFVRQGGGSAPERFLSGKIELDVTYRPDLLRVTAYLHSFSSQLSRKFNDDFCGDFRQEHARAYGDAETIFQTDFTEGSGGVPSGGGGHHARGGG